MEKVMTDEKDTLTLVEISLKVFELYLKEAEAHQETRDELLKVVVKLKELQTIRNMETLQRRHYDR
jgi:hypothetical protein